MFPTTHTLLLAIALTTCSTAWGQSNPAAGRAVGELEAIASLDVPRYMGRWYEVAKFPNRFQKQCLANASAEYSLAPNKSVKVVNRCQIVGGEMEVVSGEARQLGAANSPKLEVRFAPSWLSFLPIVWGNYWVIDLDADYQLAAVSEPGRDYLWILSRSPQVDTPRYEALLARLRVKGLDVGRLELSVQRSITP